MGRGRRLTHHDFKNIKRAYVCNFCLRRYEVKSKVDLPLHCHCGNADWIFFQSRAESVRYAELRLLETNGVIKDLERQPKYKLLAAQFDAAGRHCLGLEVGTFTADFSYIEAGERVVEDTKGYMGMTDIAEWKHRHFAAQFGFSVRVVKMK